MASHQAPRRIWQLPTFVLGLIAVWAAATYGTPPNRPDTQHFDRFDDLAAALDRKPSDIAQVQSLVRTLTDAPRVSPQGHYLLGSAYVLLASSQPTESADYWTLAVQHFDACDANALKPEEAARLIFRAAKARAAVGAGDPAATMAVLMNPPSGEDRSECPRLIAECALRLPTPDLARARDELTSYLGGPHKASQSAADRYKFRLAELNFALNDSERARQWLNDISSSAPPEVQVAAKRALAQHAQAEKNWPEAARLLQAALSVPSQSATTQNVLHYEVAEVLRKMGDGVKALPHFEQAARDTSVIGGRASMRLAEIRGLDPDAVGRRGEAVEWLERAIALLPAEVIGQPERAIAEALIASFRREGDFASAMRASTAYGKIAEGKADLNQRVEILAAWGEALQKSGDPGASAKFAAAAQDAKTLADAIPGERIRALKRAAGLYRLAGQPSAALAILDELIAAPDQNAGEVAVYHLERAELLPPNDFEGLKTTLEAAMNRAAPASAVGLSARMKLALLHINRGQDLLATLPGAQYPDAVKLEAEQIGQFGRQLLKQVADSSTVPVEARATHEQALFESGRLGLRDSRFSDAEAVFKKQLSLYPSGSFSGYGRLWLVCALLQQARGSDEARKIYEEALGHLKPLTQSADVYLRTYGEIWTANTMLELGDAAAVVPMAKEMMAKYQGKPEELVAGKLLFYAYLKMPTPEPAEASRVLDRMEGAFKELPATAYPNDPEYSHERWKTELPRLREELRKFTP